MREATSLPASAARITDPRPDTDTSSGLGAPLYIAWQLTNECNLACLHCIEESGPGHAFSDEMTEPQISRFLEQVCDNDVPYMSFSGGEPMLHPKFFDMVDYVCSRGIQLKVETNGHYLTEENCRRMKNAGVKAVQVSLDGVTARNYKKLRIRGDFSRLIAGIRNLAKAQVPIEINFSPTLFNMQEASDAVDLAYDLGAASFYTGRTMYTGNAVKCWPKLVPTEDQYLVLFDMLRRKTAEYKGRMRVDFHEGGLLQELRYRLQHPAALLIVLPNGLVKLINALPFICGDLRRDSLTTVWENFQRAWQHPHVERFVEDLSEDPGHTRDLHKWVYL
jgi:MoaA/NifB/PqqE/SkfB family radical SAM enzyme